MRIVKRGSTDWKQKHKKEASTKFEQEMEHFLKNVPEKVAIRSQIDGRKRSVSNVNTKFLNRKNEIIKACKQVIFRTLQG